MGRHDDFGGLRRDLPHMIGRRDALRWLGGSGLAGLLAACGLDAERGEPTTTAAAGAEIPDEAAGPFPADGSNGPSAASLARLSLDTDGVFRDRWEDQLALVSGSVAEGYAARLLVRV